jgi:hypothetical protein
MATVNLVDNLMDCPLDGGLFDVSANLPLGQCRIRRSRPILWTQKRTGDGIDETIGILGTTKKSRECERVHIRFGGRMFPSTPIAGGAENEVRL